MHFSVIILIDIFSYYSRYNLPNSMIGACHKSLRCADVVGVVHDVSNRYTKDFLHPDVINMLNVIAETPSFLIINKVSGCHCNIIIFMFS